MASHPDSFTAFGLNVQLIWQTLPIPDTHESTHACNDKTFYLAIPGVARFLAEPEKNCIVIEKAHDHIPLSIINTWLMGTVIAYILQYHNYLVLHGAAVLMQGHAVIFCGHSGAGKSTLASALLKQGYPFITDDVVAIKHNEQGQYGVVPGPTYSKLWQDSLAHLDYDTSHAKPIHFKTNKFSIPITQSCDLPFIPIAAFYELGINPEATTLTHQRLTGLLSLQTLIKNAYRYFMLKPLGKLQHFLNDCSQLAQHKSINTLIRPPNFTELSRMIQHIEFEQGR